MNIAIRFPKGYVAIRPGEALTIEEALTRLRKTREQALEVLE